MEFRIVPAQLVVYNHEKMVEPSTWAGLVALVHLRRLSH